MKPSIEACDADIRLKCETEAAGVEERLIEEAFAFLRRVEQKTVR